MMKILFDASWAQPIEPSRFLDYGIVGADSLITTLGDNTYDLSLEPLYKGTPGVDLQEYTFRLILEKGDFILVGTIDQSGRKTREYRSVAKKVASKPYLQATLDQIQSKWNKKRDKDGWRVTKEQDLGYIPEPQLLHRWDKAKKREGPWLVGTKLDGIRSPYMRGQMYSRKRSVFTLPDICNEAAYHGIGLDGEIYKDGSSWEEISGAVSRENDDSGRTSEGLPITLFKFELEYWVFDRHDMPKEGYVQRLDSLLSLDLSDTPRIHIIPSVYCETEDEVQEASDGMIKLGFEGACAYTLDGLYVPDSRSWDVLKVKPLFSKEFLLHTICYDWDAVFGKLIAYRLVADNGKLFKATPASSKKDRAEAYQKLRLQGFEDVWMTCEYRDVYVSGIPKHAVAKGIRNPEDSINGR